MGGVTFQHAKRLLLEILETYSFEIVKITRNSLNNKANKIKKKQQFINGPGELTTTVDRQNMPHSEPTIQKHKYWHRKRC